MDEKEQFLREFTNQLFDWFETRDFNLLVTIGSWAAVAHSPEANIYLGEFLKRFDYVSADQGEQSLHEGEL